VRIITPISCNLDPFWFKSPRDFPLCAEFSTQTDSRLVVKQGYDKRNRTLALSCRRLSRTWAASPAGVIKDISCGLSLALGRRLQRPTISPFSIPQPRQLPQNTSHELRRLPSASFTDEPHPVLLPFTTKERIRAAYLTALWGVSTSCAEAPLIPGFTPAARRTSHLVLRSCFRPGTRLGLSRKPNLQQPAILSVTSCLQNLENSGMSSRRFALPQPCHFRFSKSFKR